MSVAANTSSRTSSQAGVPAKMRRELGDADRELILQYARNYVDYTAIYLAETAGT